MPARHNPPDCPASLSSELTLRVRNLGKAWAKSAERPRLDQNVAACWRKLIRDWSNDEGLPLFIRKQGLPRGAKLLHKSQRCLVPTDNSPAQWVFLIALTGVCPTIENIRKWTGFQSDKADAHPCIPAFLALKKTEGVPAYKCALKRRHSVNTYGWKLAHIDAIGFNSAGSVEDLSIETIKDHFIRLMCPTNVFLVPKTWSGLAEVPEVIQAVKEFDCRRS